jgi:hypothetical protein
VTSVTIGHAPRTGTEVGGSFGRVEVGKLTFFEERGSSERVGVGRRHITKQPDLSLSSSSRARTNAAVRAVPLTA